MGFKGQVWLVRKTSNIQQGTWGGVWSPQVKVVNGGETIALCGDGPYRV